MEITSRENPIVKEVCSLVTSARARRESGLFVCEGARLASDFAGSGIAVRRLLVTEKALGKYGKYIKEIEKAGVSADIVSESVSEKISDTVSPQGVFAVMEKPSGKADLSQNGLYVMLSDLQDPGNIGTILRTCDAMDVRGVIVSGCADVWSPKVLRSSMGALSRLRITETGTSEEALSLLSENGVRTYASALHRNAVSLPEAEFSEKSCVLIGNEGNGLSDKTIEDCDEVVFIPMPGCAESLNAASAASILIYEAAMKLNGKAAM